MADLTIKELRELLNYDAVTGIITWRERPRQFFNNDRAFSAWNARYCGKRAFVCTDGRNGYLFGRIFNRPYYTHRLIWCLHHEEWPSGDIDHVNGDVTDNRIENLRDVPHMINLRNQRKSKNNKSGHTGVYYRKDRCTWIAEIKVNGVTLFLGSFDNIEGAIQAREAANRIHGFHKNHGR